MVHGPHAGLTELNGPAGELKGHRVNAVRGASWSARATRSRPCRPRAARAARAACESVAAQTLGLPEQRYVQARAERLRD